MFEIQNPFIPKENKWEIGSQAHKSYAVHTVT